MRFILEHVTPSTNQAVLLVPSTELHVLPLSGEPSSTAYSRSINNKGVVKVGCSFVFFLSKGFVLFLEIFFDQYCPQFQLAETFPRIVNNGFVSCLCSSLKFSGDNFRVLPSSLFEADKILSSLIHPNVIYVSASGELRFIGV